MSLVKKESQIITIGTPVETAYAKISDLRSLESLKQRLSDPQVQQFLATQVNADALSKVQMALDKMTYTQDTIGFELPMVGGLVFRVVERQQPSLVKMQSEHSPVEATIWAQLLPADASTSRIRVTVGAELNFLMAKMADKPLQQAADAIARMFAVL